MVTYLTVAFALFLTSVAIAQPSGSKNPIKTNVCELVRESERFNGKFVQVRAEFVSRFQWAGFVDETCSAKIPVGVFHPFDQLKREQGEYAFTTIDDDNTHPDRLKWSPIEPRVSVRLRHDESYRAFWKYTEMKFRWPDGGLCRDCPLYRITVTATARFDYFETQTVSVRATPETKAFHYSTLDPDAPMFRLVLQSVSNVAITPVNPTVYSEQKRRELTLEEAHDLVTALFRDRGSTKLRGFDLVGNADPDSHGFQYFQGIFDNPKGSFNLGHYAVDRTTGDVWDAVSECEQVTSPSVAKLQEAIRHRIGLTPDEYRKARRPGPMCDPDDWRGK